MPNSTKNDDLSFDESGPEHGLDGSWVGGELELDEQRPATGLEADPNHRKWMWVGAGACGLVTALAVVLVTSGPSSVLAAEVEAQEAEPSAGAQPAEVSPEAEVSFGAGAEVAPARTPEAEPTLAASSSAAVTRIHTAPPPPVFPGEAEPRTPASSHGGSSESAPPSSPASAPPKPSVSAEATPPLEPTPKAEPAPLEPTPVGEPSVEPPPSNPLADLPDVEAWADADDEARDDEVRDDEPAAPSPTEPTPGEPAPAL